MTSVRWNEWLNPNSWSVAARPSASGTCRYPDRRGVVRIHIPLLPMLVEVRSHPISVKLRWRALVPFRFSLRGLLLAVVVAGLYFSLCAYLVRLNSASLYHAEQATSLPWTAIRIGPPSPPGPCDRRSGRARCGFRPVPRLSRTWHREMAIGYTADFQRLFPLVLGLFLTFAFLGAVVALGRAIQALFRRSFAQTTDEPPLHPVGKPVEKDG